MGEAHSSSVPGLLATCVVMFVGAYGCGMLPSWLPISEQRLASVSRQSLQRVQYNKL
jgi:hypothetical protein